MKAKIELMKKGGGKLARVRANILALALPGVKTIDLDREAEKLILQAGGKPSFKMVKGYKWATCICVNDCIVHGIPNAYKLKNGDTVTVDIGMYYRGYHTDTAATVVVGAEGQVNRFLAVGKQALEKAIQQALPRNRIGHISQAMQQIVERAGYNVARTLVGHGIGKKLHEKPQIPCFLDGEIKATLPLKQGMTLAIEVIYMEGNAEIEQDAKDHWTIRTKDGSRSAMFEHTVLVTERKPIILTL